MRYMLQRLKPNDGAGDSGPLSSAVWLDENEEVQQEMNARPRVGVAIQVGSITARSYSSQDWWMTSTITEIVEDEPDKVIFKTGNSTYLWQILK